MQPSQSSPLRIAGPFFAGAFLLLVLAAVGQEHLHANLLDFGRSLNPPTPGFGRFLAFYGLFGTLAAACFALAAVRLAARADLGHRLATAWDTAPDGKWMLYASLLAFLVPAALRHWLLRGFPLTDDEAAYRFMAQLLAEGRLYAESESLKLFFDNRFLVNDGKVYAHYFMGWPALLMPGLWLGLSGFMNALYSALTVPALFRVVRRLAGSRWAKAATVLFLASPMLMLAAATELSHTSCIAALAWFTWFCLRSRDDDAGLGVHAAAATAFSIAFFIRPTSALGIGLPLLLWWLVGVLRQRQRVVVKILAFGAPAALLAGLFFYVNWAQTGSPTSVAYQRAFEYAQENDFRFSLWAGEDDLFQEMQWISAPFTLAVVGSAIAAFAPSFEVILLGRVLQSLGTGAGMVLARAVARDMFGVSGSAAMIARITGFMVVAPMVAPTIGGLVIEYIRWRGVFGAIGVFSAVLLVWAQARFQESLQNTSESLGLASVFRDYARILGKRAFVAYCSYTALSIGTFFLFIGAAPYLMEQRYGLTPAEYGLLFIGVSLAFMAANFYSARAAARFGARNVVLYAPLFSVGWSLVVAALLAAGVGGVGYLGAVLAVAVCIGNAVSAGLATPQAVAGAVNTSPDRAGSASGLIAVVQFGTAGVVAQLSTLLSPTSAIALPIGMAALAAGSTLAFWALGRGEE